MRDNHLAVTWDQGRSVTVTHWLGVYTDHRRGRSEKREPMCDRLPSKNGRDLAAEVPQCAAWLAGRQRLTVDDFRRAG
jgi:hypothetical protein